MYFEFEKNLNLAASRLELSPSDTLNEFIKFSLTRARELCYKKNTRYEEQTVQNDYVFYNVLGGDKFTNEYRILYEKVRKMMRRSLAFNSAMFASTKQEHDENGARARIYRQENLRLPFSFKDMSCGTGTRILAALGYVHAHYGSNALQNKEVIIADEDPTLVCIALFQILQHVDYYKVVISKIEARCVGLKNPVIYSCVDTKRSELQQVKIEMNVDRLIAA